MKKLTKGQRFALAREARRLAMECLENGPRMNSGSWCRCAAGIVVERAGLAGNTRQDHTDMAMHVDEFLTDDPSWLGLVSFAVNEREWRDNPTAVVFPLLALADALEASNASARKRPQKQSPEVP